MKHFLSILLAVLFLFLLSIPACSESAFPEGIEIEDVDMNGGGDAGVAPSVSVEISPRASFIDDIIALGRQLYEKADGKYQRAYLKSDIYVCKNFTVYLFRQNRAKYRMAEFPDVELRIPNNLPEKQCRPYAYGYCWEEIPASRGNPFELAAQFLYDSNQTKEENRARALDFMKQVRRGDYFQMTGDYSGGKGAHSAIFISDYDPADNTVHSMDSNRVGKRINGQRYGKVLFDSVMQIDEWVDFFCLKKCGATLYRLRDDIIFADQID